MGLRRSLIAAFTALLVAGPAACADRDGTCGVPTGSNASVEWITFGMWLSPQNAVPTFVAFADGVADRGGGGTDRRKVELSRAELMAGEVPGRVELSKATVRASGQAAEDGHRLLVWGRRGFATATAFGDAAAVSDDGSVRFLGNCIPRFDEAFAAFAASAASGGSAERPVDVLVRILTEPTGETAQRFRSTTGLTKAGP